MGMMMVSSLAHDLREIAWYSDQRPSSGRGQDRLCGEKGRTSQKEEVEKLHIRREGVRSESEAWCRVIPSLSGRSEHSS